MTTTKTIGRDLPNGDYIEITAQLREGDSRGLSDGFSVTCSGWEKRGTWSGRAAKRNGRESVYGGADHETILKAAPELYALVKVHLADPDGTPMHAEANGWYFYSGAHVDYEQKNYGEEYIRRHGSPQERAARCLHIDPDELPAGLDKEQFSELCRHLAEHVWPRQAKVAKQILESMTDGEGVEE